MWMAQTKYSITDYMHIHELHASLYMYMYFYKKKKVPEEDKSTSAETPSVVVAL